MSRRFASTQLIMGLSILLSLGCTSTLFRAQSPDTGELSTLVDDELGRTRFVGDLAAPWGNRPRKVEGIALVTQLDGTGSDPPPSPILDQLKKEMQTHEIRDMNLTLSSLDTAVVMVGGYIPPGAQKGDTFDVQVSTPPRSQTKSLRGGWLMQSRLRQVMVVERQLHTGEVIGLAQGEVLANALFHPTEKDAVGELRGRVLGGGVVLKDQLFGLGIFNEHSSVRTSAMIGTAINSRFHHFNRGEKSGVAKPLRDNQVQLAMHARYKHNFGRYLRVIMNIAISETPAERSARLVLLDRMLQEPTTAERAALQLEAIGHDASAILRRGLTSPDAEVRFYAAEALAYLDDPDASEPLYESARDIRAFRWRALTALAAMDQVGAREALARLMNSPSAETRYGAFRALRLSDPNDPLVRGQVLAKSFGYHVIGTNAEPMIHFSRAHRPEMVLFGHGQRLQSPAVLFAGKHLLIKASEDGQLKVSRFRPGEETQHVTCSPELEELIPTLVEQGGSYQEVLAMVENAKAKGYLASRVETGALPSQSRVFRREDQPAGEPTYHVTNPVPEMFADRLDSDSGAEADAQYDQVEPADEAEKPTEEGWFGRMTSWFSG